MKANPSRGILDAVPRARAAHRRLQRPRGRARAAGRLPAGRDPAHLADALAAAGRARRPRRALQRLLARTSSSASGGVAAGREVSVRMNPGLGSGATNRTNTGGPASSFGIWHEYLGRRDDARRALRPADHAACTATSAPAPIPRCGSACTRMTLDLAARLPDVRTVNLGGGFKVGRMPGEPSVDMADVGAHVQRRAASTSASATAARCTWRSSRAPTSSPTPAPSSPPASTSSTPGATATCSPSSTPA